MTMKELCEYSEGARRTRNNVHLELVRLQYGEIRNFTAKESGKVVTRGKSVFRKGKTHAFRGLWNHNNVPIQS
jgi:hypothetical protein